MSNPITVPPHRTAIKGLALISGLMVLLSLVLPPTISAAPPTPSGAEKCAECHEPETDAWQNSPHAKASGEAGALGATCEGCHGPYVKDHPEAGIMQLTVDSSACENCHTDTFAQWEDSMHAQAGVQCIGCHLSHSQEFRLTDEALCGACHGDRARGFDDTCHGMAGVACTDCHLSSTDDVSQIAWSNTDEIGDMKPVGLTWSSADQTGDSNPAIMAWLGGNEVRGANPAALSHDFTKVTSADCMTCHQQNAHEESLCQHGDRTAHLQLVSNPDLIPKLAAELETAQQTNKSLQAMSLVCLGLGMGIGGMLGIVFMLVFGYIDQRMEQK